LQTESGGGVSQQSGIEWTDATWNPWYGCKKVSPACAHCYAEREMTRYGRDFNTVTRAKDGSFYAPLKWKEPRKIFTCSWSDFFIKDADAWRGEAWNVIMQTPRHTYLVLTKRTERIGNCKLAWPQHIWLGASVETPRQYRRVDELREIPACIRFLSMEPLLAETCNTNLEGIHWVIVGTESGPGARFTDLHWIRRIKDKCKAEGVAFFLKQLTTRGGIKIPFESWPEDLRVREFPNAA
jgi:protein gp37